MKFENPFKSEPAKPEYERNEDEGRLDVDAAQDEANMMKARFAEASQASSFDEDWNEFNKLRAGKLGVGEADINTWNQSEWTPKAYDAVYADIQDLKERAAQEPAMYKMFGKVLNVAFASTYGLGARAEGKIISFLQRNFGKPEDVDENGKGSFERSAESMIKFVDDAFKEKVANTDRAKSLAEEGRKMAMEDADFERYTAEPNLPNPEILSENPEDFERISLHLSGFRIKTRAMMMDARDMAPYGERQGIKSKRGDLFWSQLKTIELRREIAKNVEDNLMYAVRAYQAKHEKDPAIDKRVAQIDADFRFTKDEFERDQKERQQLDHLKGMAVKAFGLAA
jgi:hypothetical protein